MPEELKFSEFPSQASLEEGDFVTGYREGTPNSNARWPKSLVDSSTKIPLSGTEPTAPITGKLVYEGKDNSLVIGDNPGNDQPGLVSDGVLQLVGASVAIGSSTSPFNIVELTSEGLVCSADVKIDNQFKFILQSPDLTLWAVSVDNSGNLSAAQL